MLETLVMSIPLSGRTEHGKARLNYAALMREYAAVCQGERQERGESYVRTHHDASQALTRTFLNQVLPGRVFRSPIHAAGFVGEDLYYVRPPKRDVSITPEMRRSLIDLAKRESLRLLKLPRLVALPKTYIIRKIVHTVLEPERLTYTVNAEQVSEREALFFYFRFSNQRF